MAGMSCTGCLRTSLPAGVVENRHRSILPLCCPAHGPRTCAAMTFSLLRREAAREGHRCSGGRPGRGSTLPSELSGGEQQRVAIARALANDPPILIADEPTGSLDTATGEHIMQLLLELSYQGKSVVFVTHDVNIASHAQRVIRVQDGEIVSDEVLKRNE